MSTPTTKPPGVPWVAYAKKASVAAITGSLAVLGVLTVAVTAGSDAGTAISPQEWLQAAWVGLNAIAGTVGVYVARNQTGVRG